MCFIFNLLQTYLLIKLTTINTFLLKSITNIIKNIEKVLIRKKKIKKLLFVVIFNEII